MFMDFSKLRTYFIKNKKHVIIEIFLLIFILYLAMFISPKVYINTEIKDVSDKDYNIFINNNDNIQRLIKIRTIADI